VIHIQGNPQCAYCLIVCDLAEEKVKINFKNELASGGCMFAHLNAELQENSALASKYGVTE